MTLLVENHEGVLSRIAGLFSGRGYNLESFTAGPAVDPTTSRITLVCGGDDQVIDQIKKQLNRLVDVITVVDLTKDPSVDRELALVRVKARSGERGEIFQIADIFGARVMDVATESIMLELTGSSEKIDDFIALLGGSAIQEFARSGIVSMARGRKNTDVKQRTNKEYGNE
jgi:acetolactate synthase-1/3 small subunit